MPKRPDAIVVERIMDALDDLYKANLLPMSGSGAPSSATFSGARRGQGGRGCQYTDEDTGLIWVNEGTKASPSVDILGTQPT